jgi:hypothetical protein
MKANKDNIKDGDKIYMNDWTYKVLDVFPSEVRLKNEWGMIRCWSYEQLAKNDARVIKWV